MDEMYHFTSYIIILELYNVNKHVKSIQSKKLRNRISSIDTTQISGPVGDKIHFHHKSLHKTMKCLHAIAEAQSNLPFPPVDVSYIARGKY